MLQAWLWFGLLDVFFEQLEAVDVNEFLSDKVSGNSSITVDTSALPALLSKWEQWIQSLSLEQRDNYLQIVKSVLKEVSYFCHSHFGEHGSKAPK